MTCADADLFGRPLAEAAHRIAQIIDPSCDGLAVADLRAQIETSGQAIRGDDPLRTLGSALNGAQSLFDRVGRGLWAWKPMESIDGLTGRDLLEDLQLQAKRT